ncbi:MAG: hypothetical protein RLZZ374_1752 [Cyanobacteriota bacterium]
MIALDLAELVGSAIAFLVNAAILVLVMEGFLDLRLPLWQRRLLTRGMALIPALATVLLLGEGATNQLLVLSEVVLSL